MIDYRHENVPEAVRNLTQGAGVDRVVEVDIAANGNLDAELIRPGGEIVVYGSGAREFALPFLPLIVRNVSLHFFIVYNLTDVDRESAGSRTLAGHHAGDNCSTTSRSVCRFRRSLPHTSMWSRVDS